MKILAVFPHLELLEVAGLALESSLGAEVLRANSDKQGLQLLTEQRATLDLVVIDGSEASLQAFALIEKAAEKKLQYVVCLRGQAKDQIKIEGLEIVGVADYDRLVADLTAMVGSLPGTKGATTEKTEEEKLYCRVATSVLIAASPLDADMYIRLSATHFVKLFQTGDAFEKSDLEKYYEQKKVGFLHLLVTDAKKLIERLNQVIQEMLKANKIDLRKAEALVEETVDTIHELVSQVGVTPEIEELVSNNVNLAMKAMGDYPELKSILGRLEMEKDKYIPSHSMLTAHLACSLAVAMDWVSDSTFQKLTMAAMMHDVALRDHRLCADQSLQDMEKNYQGKFSTREVQEYKNHPKKGAQLVAQFKEIGAEVDKVVLQHHEHPLGTGFPDSINASYITPLSAVFITAHDLVDWIFKHEGKIDINEYIVENEAKLAAGPFKKVLKGLLEMASEVG